VLLTFWVMMKGGESFGGVLPGAISQPFHPDLEEHSQLSLFFMFQCFLFSSSYRI